MLCSGLMLLGPDACSKKFAAKLLPSITPLLASLYEAAPSHDDPLADLAEEYHLGPLLKVMESGDHPYKPSYSADWTIESTQEVLPSELEMSSSRGSWSRDGGSCGSWAHVSHAPCVWLAFDKRCSTVETEAWLDVLVDSKLAHTFSGPPSKWPSRPLVLPAGRITFRYKMVGCAASRKLPNRPRWGYRISVHAYEPSLSSTLPLLVDCQKALASLGAKYAAILLQGEPLSPEEHAHADELEKLPLPEPPGTALPEPPAIPLAVPPAAWLAEDDASSFSAPPQADAEAAATASAAMWRGSRVPSALRFALLQKRQRRASNRAAALEGFMRLLDAAPSASVQRHVLLQIARALRTMQTSDKSSLLRCQFLHGCRGCSVATWGQLGDSIARLFSLIARQLTASLIALAATQAAARASSACAEPAAEVGIMMQPMQVAMPRVTVTAPNFVKSEAFAGSRNGYTYKRGEHGLGYYRKLGYHPDRLPADTNDHPPSVGGMRLEGRLTASASAADPSSPPLPPPLPPPSVQAAEETVLILLNVFLLRFQRGDLELLDAAGLLPMLTHLQWATGRVRPVCRRVFRQLLLFTFSHRKVDHPLTPFQHGLLKAMRLEVATVLALPQPKPNRLRAAHDDADADAIPQSIPNKEQERASAAAQALLPSVTHRQQQRLSSKAARVLSSVLSMLHSISASTAVCRALGEEWLPLLLQLLREGNLSLAGSAARLLRAVMPMLTPSEHGALCDQAVCEAFPQSIAASTFSQSVAASATLAVDVQLREAPRLIVLLLEAIGREVLGDEPLVALCVSAGEVELEVVDGEAEEVAPPGSAGLSSPPGSACVSSEQREQSLIRDVECERSQIRDTEVAAQESMRTREEAALAIETAQTEAQRADQGGNPPPPEEDAASGRMLVRRQGSPDSPIATEMIAMLRLLQRSASGGEWARSAWRAATSTRSSQGHALFAGSRGCVAHLPLCSPSTPRRLC